MYVCTCVPYHVCTVSICVNSCRILDDKEFYEKEEPFKLADLVQLSQLLNQIAFSLIWKVRTCMCVYIQYICVCTYVCMFVHTVCVYVHTYMYVCVYMCTYVRTCVCTYM